MFRKTKVETETEVETELPMGDKLGKNPLSTAGTYNIERIQKKTLDEIRAFIDAAIALHGGGSKFQVIDARDHEPGRIRLELEADIKAKAAAMAKLTPQERNILGIR